MTLFAAIPDDQLDTIDHISNGAAIYTGTYGECDEWCDTQQADAYRIIEICDITWRADDDADLLQAATRFETARVELDAAVRRARAKGRPLRQIADVTGITHESVRTRTNN